MLYFSRLKVFSIISVIFIGIYFFLPNLSFFNNSKFFSEKRVNLGLDLQGGSYLLLEIDSNPLIEQRLQTKSLEVRRELRKNNIQYKNFSFSKNSLVFTFDEKQKETLDKILNERSVNSNIKTGGKEFEIIYENNIIKLIFTKENINLIKKNALDQSIEIVRNRIDELGTKEPNIVTRGLDRILVELPGLKDPSAIKKLLGKTAKLTLRFVANSSDENSLGVETLSSKSSGSQYSVEKRIIISGENLIDAQPGFDQLNNSSVVNFKLDNIGSRKFALASKENVGRYLAIVLDKDVVSSPVIREAIVTGSGQISGNFTTQEANELAILLRAGALPAPLNIIEERSVGPDLGKESIEKGILSLIIGFLLVMIYMIYNYRIFGVFSNVSLLTNLVLISGVLSIFGATLTLPGIAGIILTVGMAVDSNVLIYERVKEELKKEKNYLIAFDTAYKKVLTTILDSNVTTLIAAFVLYYMGSGPVKGFAITLGIGILSTFFTTYVLGRLLVAKYIKNNKETIIVI
ncbi:protein-export membrane protein SecD [Candidatus Pelagibacter sp. IMCC9063]|uniref:protein translocase subunit SecD n=1 Tax=Pelagibacter sp. (strain IMCC9063) TaxID=1002672 RepID=UPI0002046855|nr:protein translocase subunit SecD [Candidatus Pelagibacter sp. IMCC9063]AEA81605.1 protein-export membrane protein SecD [Candidatus Pelagibacter sp. IMCC9063]